MTALETVGYSLGVIAFVAAALLFMMGGPAYRRPSPPKENTPSDASSGPSPSRPDGNE
ncbi:hypothetical protein [Streptomyces sp. TS71-3]|uniref:hypothetical protein n=1 Tax=Streptomyces sp. TS71-3 TaxID=2733862 RepID=UPI001B132BA9|nr:hypothetical protein [Streptomyces sp. TS71-3]GHJ41758.1 hypothetical protein Sm713_73670 [Streptomyces sp. TS71-3]